MLTRKEGTVAERVKDSPSGCSHHWVIGIANGPTSKGVCRLCGAEQEFKNYLDGTHWDNDEPTPRHASGAVAPSLYADMESGEES